MPGQGQVNNGSSNANRFMLFVGLLILAVVVISLFLFPTWRSTTEGIIVLLGLATIGVVAVVKNLTDIYKTINELDNTRKETIKKIRTNKRTGVFSPLQIGSKNKINVVGTNAVVDKPKQVGKGNEIKVDN